VCKRVGCKPHRTDQLGLAVGVLPGRSLITKGTKRRESDERALGLSLGWREIGEGDLARGWR
jgi:hypothetical protein